MGRIVLKYCTLENTDNGSRTVFGDGSHVDSFPHDIPHYYVIAHRCGYGDDILSYCREHDFFHSFCGEWFYDRPSPVLWRLAHGSEVDDSTAEELLVQTCQRWVRASERPIVGRVDWDEFRRRALELLKARLM